MVIDWLKEAKQAYEAGDRQAATAAALIVLADRMTKDAAHGSRAR